MPESTLLEENVVIRTGFEESIGEFVKNITVISKEYIKNTGNTNILDFLRISPFISFANGDRLDLIGQGNCVKRSI